MYMWIMILGKLKLRQKYKLNLFLGVEGFDKY